MYNQKLTENTPRFSPILVLFRVMNSLSVLGLWSRLWNCTLFQRASCSVALDWITWMYYEADCTFSDRYNCWIFKNSGLMFLLCLLAPWSWFLGTTAPWTGLLASWWYRFQNQNAHLWNFNYSFINKIKESIYHYLNFKESITITFLLFILPESRLLNC